jgi:gephyrin
MSQSRLKAAILIVSDTASQDPSTDECAPILREIFTAAGDQWEVAGIHILADDVDAIQRLVKKWTDEENWAHCVVTSGGTGFAAKDVTPEVRILFEDV